MSGLIHIPHEVAKHLAYYVYALRDPRTGLVFYVGKGTGDRINAHLREAGKDPLSERQKIQTIRDIESAGLEVELLFLRTGITEEATAFAIEQAVIDAHAASGHALTNLVRGHHSSVHGLATLPVVVARHQAQQCPPIPHAVLMFKIQKGWRPDMSKDDIFEQTRGHWRIAPWVRERAEYALGIAYGVVYGAYRIDSWFPSEMPWDQGKNRWGFNGGETPELEYVIGTQVRDAFPNQVMYRRFLEGYPGPVAGAREAVSSS